MLRESLQRWVASAVTGEVTLRLRRGDESTVVGYGPNAAARYITTYFRRTFVVANASLFQSIDLRVIRDDGAVVYLDGQEIVRSNMPTGTITPSTLASAAAGSAFLPLRGLRPEAGLPRATFSPSSEIGRAHV